ncbi:MAG: monomeric [FeFe] hydrogenase [Pleomorphochaeta sp.]
MLEINNQFTHLKNKVYATVLKSYFNGTLEDDIDKIPFWIIPKDTDPSRCCIYKERAMIRYRILAFLGVNIEKDDDELKSLKQFYKEALETPMKPLPVLTTISTACSACPKDQYLISDACRGCYARPCLANCPANAIVFVDGKAKIDQEKCIRCGKCQEVCPFNSVLHTPVPCEGACPVGAIKKNEKGFVEIDYKKCISCGKCSRSCPFGAIVERSGLLPILELMRKEEKTVAIIAPSIDGQFPGNLAQIKKALKAIGFDDVVEVSEGAEITSIREAKELEHRLSNGDKLMSTSCCPAYVELIEKHLPNLKAIKSDTLSPMAYTAQLVKEKDENAKVVFIGPCLAKRVEATKLDCIDGVMTYNELASIFIAKDIDVKEIEEDDLGETETFEDCREFAVSQGVTGCVLKRVSDPSIVKAYNIDGIDNKAFKMLKVIDKIPSKGNFVEVMCCEGGCINGPGTIVKPKIALKLRNGNTKSIDNAMKKKSLY